MKASSLEPGVDGGRLTRDVGDREDRFRRLFDAGYAPLHAYARRRIDPAEVDDLVAETLAVAWRRLDDVPSGDRALAWLFGVARNVLANQRRARRRRNGLVLRIARQPTAPVAPSPAAEAPVVAALAQLRHDDQEILRLAAWEQLEPREIALALGCTPNAAALRLSRARRRLREAMTATASSRTGEVGKVTDA